MQDEKLKKEFFTSLKDCEFKLTEQSAYEIALWIESNEKHLSASQQNNFTKYSLGEIFLVDLGWNNYDRELGKTSNQFFDRIYNKLFEQIFEPIHYKMKKLENNQ